MSDHIPFEIQEEIIKGLPIKSLLQFRSVSKPWKSFIDSSEFVISYHHSQTQKKRNYVPLVDDGTFPPLPLSVTLLKYPTIAGSSQGLVCFFGINASIDSRTGLADSYTRTTVIWNPTIRKSITISVPNFSYFQYRYVVGFGVTPDTCDPKLVMVSFRGYKTDTVVEVFTLSTKAWKRLTTNLPHNSIVLEDNQVVIDRFISWRAYDLDYEEYAIRFHVHEEIMSFDMITEEFKKLDVPDSLDGNYQHLFISKVRESLVVVQMVLKDYDTIEAVSVWMMEHGNPKLLTKKFTINTPNDIIEVCSLRKSGEPLIAMTEDNVEHELNELFVCDENLGNFGITPMVYSCKVNSCIKTLLLLDH